VTGQVVTRIYLFIYYLYIYHINKYIIIVTGSRDGWPDGEGAREVSNPVSTAPPCF
jgi:hypothetical protein